MGLSGKTLIQIFAPLFTFLVIALLADSICLEVSIPREVAFRAKVPKLIVLPRIALPVFLPFCCFLYLVLLG